MNQQQRTVLYHCGLFSGIAPERVDAMLGCLSARQERYEKNTVVWNIGDTLHSCALVLSGCLRAESVNAGGEHLLMATHRAGALVGDVLMATPGSKSPVYVVASEDTELLFLPFHRIMSGCSECCGWHGKLRENLVSEIAMKFWAQRQRTLYLSAKSLRQRIAMRLYDEYRRTGSLTFSLGGTREDLADFLGANRSALSREIGRMKEDGILDYYKDTFRILDLEKLCRDVG